MMWNNSLYGNYRNFKFTQIWEDVNEFLQDYGTPGDNPDAPLGIAPTISTNSATTLYYLLLARYANSTVASSDPNRFKLQVLAIIFQYGPTWEKNLEIQKELRGLSLEELLDGGKAIYNHSLNPSTAPSTNTLEELTTINDQNVTKYKKNRVDAYRILTDLLKTDVTGYFLDKFKSLFLTIVEPEVPLWYVTDLITEGDDNDGN